MKKSDKMRELTKKLAIQPIHKKEEKVEKIEEKAEKQESIIEKVKKKIVKKK